MHELLILAQWQMEAIAIAVNTWWAAWGLDFPLP